jgi:hypothetical protein
VQVKWPLLFSFLMAHGVAWADLPMSDEATAQLLFREGKALLDAGKYPEACVKLEESQRLWAGSGTLFNLADCYEKTGRLASAWAAFVKVAADTKAKNQTERHEVATSRAQRLEPRVGKLKIEVRERSPGLELKRDGRPLAEAMWGVAVPLDAGDHPVEAAAPGRRPWRSTVRVVDGEVTRVEVPTLEIESAPPPPPPPPPQVPDKPKDEDPPRTQATLGWIALGAGALFTGLGVVGLLQRESAVAEYNDDPACPPRGQPGPPACDDRVSRASTWQTLSIVGFAVGGAAVLGGAALLLTAPSSSRSRHACAPGLLSVHCVVRF